LVSNIGLAISISISITFTDGKLSSVTDGLGVEYVYEFEVNDNLVAVLYPDATPNDVADNPRRIYHYENTQYPNHLVGIPDENGDYYAQLSRI